MPKIISTVFPAFCLEGPGRSRIRDQDESVATKACEPVMILGSSIGGGQDRLRSLGSGPV